MSTVCVPCFDRGKKDVPAIRFVPLRGESVPMCEPCWGGGQGPGLGWKPKLETRPTKPLVTEPDVKKPNGTPDVATLIRAHSHLPQKPKCKFCGLDVHRGRCRQRAEAQRAAGVPEAPGAPSGREVSRYEELIADLRERKRKIDAAIEALETLKEVLF